MGDERNGPHARARAFGIGISMMLGCYHGADGAGAGGDATPDDDAAGSADDDAADDDDGEPVDEDAVGISGLRRLTAAEYDQTIIDLVGVDPDAELVLPEDLRSPFDNDYRDQNVSASLIEGADLLAGEIAEQVVDDPTLRGAIVPCVPSGPADEACLREFISTFGRRALRRTLTEDEVGVLAGFIDHADEAGDFWVAVDSVLRTLLQHTELLYRVEIGTPVADEPGLFRLSDNEVATRLSYLLWGSTPPDWLIDAAESGTLNSSEEIGAAAQMLMADDHARARVLRFHGMWMGFERAASGGPLGEAMMLETGALLDRTVFEERAPWVDVLRAEETFVSDELATHYGLTWPGGTEPQWVPYADSGRRGLLSHGSFLGVGVKNGDTSATLRGRNIRQNVLCQVIPPPPEVVNTDADPPGFDPDVQCKVEKYAVYSSRADCVGCHQNMDPIGLGLENYDAGGRWRDTQPDRPDCPIDGHGAVYENGAVVAEFDGPAGLADLVAESPTLNQCIVTQIYKFAVGRAELDPIDTEFVDTMVTTLGEGKLVFDQVLFELVKSAEFRHRREEEV